MDNPFEAINKTLVKWLNGLLWFITGSLATLFVLWLSGRLNF